MRILIDIEITTRAKRAIRWVLLPAAAFLGTVTVAHATLDPAPSTWAISGRPISANSLARNLVQLDSRVTTLEDFQKKVTSSGGFSGGATFVKQTSTTYLGGAVGGYVGARNKCQSAVGTTSAHMCSGEETIRSAQLGMLGTADGYFSTADAIYGTPNDDCYGWTDSTGAHYGEYWAFGRANASGCVTPHPILCCD